MESPTTMTRIQTVGSTRRLLHRITTLILAATFIALSINHANTNVFAEESKHGPNEQFETAGFPACFVPLLSLQFGVAVHFGE